MFIDSPDSSSHRPLRAGDSMHTHRPEGQQSAPRVGREIHRQIGCACTLSRTVRSVARKMWATNGRASCQSPLGTRGRDVLKVDIMLPMTGSSLVVVAAAFLFYAVLSRRLDDTPLTAAMIFVVAGFVLSNEGLDWLHFSVDQEGVQLLAEATLAVVLFTDASRIDLHTLRREYGVPARLLAVGLPLTIVAGSIVGSVVLHSITWTEAVVVAIVLAPTDAALGQAVVTNPGLAVSHTPRTQRRERPERRPLRAAPRDRTRALRRPMPGSSPTRMRQPSSPKPSAGASPAGSSPAWWRRRP